MVYSSSCSGEISDVTCNSIDQSIVDDEYSRIMLNKFCEVINFFLGISNRILLIKKLLYAHDDEHIVT